MPFGLAAPRFDKRPIVKRVLAVAGLLLLGALGSGLWDVVLKPAFRQLGYWMLDLASLGLHAFRTDVYKQIATGSTVAPSIFAALLLAVFVTMHFIDRMRRIHTNFSRNRAFVDKRRKTGEHGRSSEPSPLSTPEEKEGSTEQRADRWLPVLRGLIYFTDVVTIVMIAMFFGLLAEFNYQALAVVHYQQMLKITGPYLSVSERSEIESRFAQIESKSDYVAVLGGLEKTAKEHGQSVPKFQPW